MDRLSSKKIPSMQKNYNNLQDIFATSCDILQYQDILKKIKPEKDKNWKNKEFENMRIEIELIDMLFYVHCERIDRGYNDFLIARQSINNVPIYFQLEAFTDNDHNYHTGFILFSKNPKLFVEECIVPEQFRDELYKFLYIIINHLE